MNPPDFGAIKHAEMVEMCRDMEQRLVKDGNPFSGDDWQLMQIVRWAQGMAVHFAHLNAESELYHRAYDLIGACDIGNFLARCEAAGKIATLEQMDKEDVE